MRCLTDNAVLLRLSRSDRITNDDKLDGKAHAGLQWSTDFNPSSAYRGSRSANTESHRWCELKSAGEIMRATTVGAKRPFIRKQHPVTDQLESGSGRGA
jgi:hypothetical protein